MTTTATSPTDAALEIPLRACEPWCREGDGHPDDHPEDRECSTEFRPVPLSRHAPVKLGGGTWVRDWLDVHLKRGPAAGEAEVGITWETEPRGITITLTLDEAAKLRDTLTALLSEADR